MLKKIGTGLMVVVLLLTLAAGAFAAGRTDYTGVEYSVANGCYYRYRINTSGPKRSVSSTTSVVFSKKNTSKTPRKMSFATTARSLWNTSLGRNIKKSWLASFPSQYGSKEYLPINVSVTVPVNKTLRVEVLYRKEQWSWQHVSQELRGEDGVDLKNYGAPTSYTSTVTHGIPIAFKYSIY